MLWNQAVCIYQWVINIKIITYSCTRTIHIAKTRKISHLCRLGDSKFSMLFLDISWLRKLRSNKLVSLGCTGFNQFHYYSKISCIRCLLSIRFIIVCKSWSCSDTFTYWSFRWPSSEFGCKSPFLQTASGNVASMREPLDGSLWWYWIAANAAKKNGASFKITIVLVICSIFVECR